MYLGRCSDCGRGHLMILCYKAECDGMDRWYAFCDKCCNTFRRGKGNPIITRTLCGLKRAWECEEKLRMLREL